MAGAAMMDRAGAAPSPADAMAAKNAPARASFRNRLHAIVKPTLPR
jgi:hypothetical protein